MNETVRRWRLRRGTVLTLCLFAGLLWGSAAMAQVGIPYTVEIAGVDNKALRSDLISVSSTFSLEERPPATVILLWRRAHEDVSLFQQVLKSQGYYDANVNVTVKEEEAPVHVVFQVETGPVYTIGKVEIDAVGEPPEFQKKLPTPAKLGLEVGKPAVARAILDAEAKLVSTLNDEGYAFARVENRKVVVDHSTKQAFVTFPVEPGPLAHFGNVTITGMESVNEKFVRNKIPWKEGQRYDAQLLAKLQKRLADTGLFGLVRVTHAQALDENGELPVEVDLKERKHRTVSAGLTYQTDEGPGGKLSWENRNLFHNGEDLKLAIIASGITYSGEGLFRKPDFLRTDQSLLISSRVADDRTDAYTSQNIEGGVTLERKLFHGTTVGSGPAFRLSNVDDELQGKQYYVLFSLPTYFNWDTSDNLLNPTHGGRLNIKVAPFLNALDTSLSFFKGYGSYSHYFPLLEHPSLIFAGRAAFGSITGASRDSIPADERFYAGGGGSIRGYAYQSVGPLKNDEPIGGRSVLEMSAEFRVKITQTIGVVAFLDGGSAFESTLPDFNETVRWGAGTGIRYYTPVGPLRLDVAMPLNRRSGVDDAYQIYLSLGQAF